MNHSKKMAAAALASVLGLVTSHETWGATQTNYVKCYGVAQASKNDCGTATSACAGSVAQPHACYAWVLVPQASCQQQGGSVGKPADGCKE